MYKLQDLTRLCFTLIKLFTHEVSTILFVSHPELFRDGVGYKFNKTKQTNNKPHKGLNKTSHFQGKKGMWAPCPLLFLQLEEGWGGGPHPSLRIGKERGSLAFWSSLWLSLSPSECSVPSTSLVPPPPDLDPIPFHLLHPGGYKRKRKPPQILSPTTWLPALLLPLVAQICLASPSGPSMPLLDLCLVLTLVQNTLPRSQPPASPSPLHVGESPSIHNLDSW